MKLNELKPAEGAKKDRKRLGRGVGSGRGKTAGRGQKGQKSRSGFSQGAGWEGGRSRLIMRLPKRGFTRPKAPLQVVNLGDLNAFSAGDEVDAAALAGRGLIRRADHPVKLLGDGNLDVSKLTVKVDLVSRAAAAALAEAGGTLVLPEGVEIAEAEPRAEEPATEAKPKKAPKAAKTASTGSEAKAESAEEGAVEAKPAKGSKAKKAVEAAEAEAAPDEAAVEPDEQAEPEASTEEGSAADKAGEN